MATVLVIENETYIVENLREILSLEGYEVLSASGGLEGVRYAQENLPDIILCDIMMNDLDGYEVLREVRSNPETASTPFIFLSAVADQPSIQRGKESGADAYITKPFTLHELLSTVEAALKGKG